MALTQERDTQRRSGKQASYAMAAVKILAGALVCLDTSNSGYADNGQVAATLVTVGVARETVDNSAGNDGDMRVEVDREGWFRFKNSADSDEITLAEVGALCYVIDEETVAKTSATAARSAAGRVRDVDADGVWIEFVQ